MRGITKEGEKGTENQRREEERRTRGNDRQKNDFHFDTILKYDYGYPHAQAPRETMIARIDHRLPTDHTTTDLQPSLLSSNAVGSWSLAERAQVVNRSFGPGAVGPPSTKPSPL